MLDVDCGGGFIVPREMRTALGLYPWWADPLFGRSLHFIASLDISRGIPG